MLKTLENTIYGYDPDEFMPIFEDGEFANKTAFIAYKIKRAGNHIADGLIKVAEITDAILYPVEAK